MIKPFKPESFAKLATVESNHWWFLALNQIIIWTVRKYISPVCDFLEIGCDTGFVFMAVSAEYPSAQLTGTEFFEEGLVHARKRIPNARFERLDARTMNDIACYDVIGAFDVLEHIGEDELVLSKLSNALRERVV